MTTLPRSQNTQHDKALTPAPCPAPPLGAPNDNVLRAIVRECLDAIEESSEGKELTTIRQELTDPIYKALGRVQGSAFETLVASAITLYGEAMFQYGFEIGRNPNAAFDLPNSPYNG